MGVSIRQDRRTGFGFVALVLGVASLVPVYGIAAIPFALLLGGLSRHRLAVTLAVVGALEQAVVVLLFL